MELYEAIEHAREVSLRGCTECHKEHGQLADWLEELERLRGALGDIYDIDRLRELVEADKDGRCVVMPCKDWLGIVFGDQEVFYGIDKDYEENPIREISVDSSSRCTWYNGWESVVLKGYDENGFDWEFLPEDIGKTVFLTREPPKPRLQRRPAMSERKPLTLEQLREMDGKPVLFVSLKDGRKKWRVVQSIEKLVEVVKVICFTDDGGETVESYGKTWLAYAAEPPILDRSAWEPCEYCRERDREVYKTQDYPGLCSFEVAQDGPDEIVVNAYNHNTPLTKDICFSFPVLFCPKCGRPLTDAAWEMLERRLER